MVSAIGVQGLRCAAIAVVLALGGGASRAEPLRLVIGTYPGPFNGDDSARGPDIEIPRQVFAAMGRDVSFEEFPPRRAWTIIASGERDGMVGASRTSERERICSFADEPLREERSVLFVRTADAGKLKFSSFDDLIGHDVAVIEPILPGSSERPFLSGELWNFLRQNGNFIKTSGVTESLRMLAAGRVDYAVAGLALAKRLIATNGLTGKIEPLLSRNVSEGGVYVCFSKARVSPAFVEAFSHALKQFKQTAAYQAIYRKYSP